jgi:hypothetical protein
MTTQAIDQPFVASTALRSVNFFNGRLLTGDDLSREQATQAALRRRLGRAAGEGIAFGFEVQEQVALSTKSLPVVTVSAGLAVTRSGIVLQLDKDLDVAIYRDATSAPAGAEPGNLFADCQPFAPGTYTAGAGVYLLTVGPDEEPEGRAPVNGLGNEDALCNVALEAEALAFRLIRLAISHDELVAKDLLRNRVAYECFGTDALAGVVANPFGPAVTSYGLLDTLRTETLTDDEAPLALIGWSIDDGIQFVDLWSVRRRLTHRAVEGDWLSVVSDRRRAEGEAMFLQFQQQILELADEPNADLLVATDIFEQLPPAGLLPIQGPGGSGFHYAEFFLGQTVRNPVYIEGSRLDELIESSFAYPPIELGSGAFTWLYVVRENAEPPQSGTRRQYMAFSSGFMPYEGNAQFDLSRWDYSNYSLRLA